MILPENSGADAISDGEEEPLTEQKDWLWSPPWKERAWSQAKLDSARFNWIWNRQTCAASFSTKSRLHFHARMQAVQHV